MSLRDELEKVLSEGKFTNDAKFVELLEFYKQMKDSGIAVKQEYDLPPLDTIGRGLYDGIRGKTRKLA